MEDTDELLSEIRFICKYLLEANEEGYQVENSDAVHLATLFKQLDSQLVEGEELPYDWSDK